MARHSEQVKLQIIDATLDLLKQVGAEGLSMRKVAGAAGISLGNLQYHYKDRSALLNALAAHYFAECMEMLDAYAPGSSVSGRQEKLKQLILFLLGHMDELSDMCRVFRELWSVATRDEAIRAGLNTYYVNLLAGMSRLLQEMGFTGKESETVVCLVLPYIEGYSVTVDALPLGKHEIADLLMGSLKGMLAQD